MHSNLMTSIRTLLAHPDRPDRDALFAAIDDFEASEILACLAPSGSLIQIAAALRIGWSWDCEVWERQIDELVGVITDPRCSVPKQMITTWSRIPSAGGVLRDRTDDLVAWAQQRLHPSWYTDLAILLGSSDASARLLVRDPSQYAIGTTLRRWSMGIDPDNPTAWQAMIHADMRAALHQNADPSWAFPAWGWDPSVDSDDVLRKIVNDLLGGWSLDHPSLRGRIGWLEHHVGSNLNLDVGNLAHVASIGRSDALTEAVCTRLGHNPSFILRIASHVPWNRLHPRLQTVIDETMRRASDRWTRTWARALGQAPVVSATSIDANLLMWRIEPERWETFDASLRAALVARSVLPLDASLRAVLDSRSDLPPHCYGWGVHPDLVAGKDHPHGKGFRFWNPDVLPDDLLAWIYADLLRTQKSLQKAGELIDLLAGLPANRRARFEPIIDWRLSGRTEAPAQSLWDWAGWAALPISKRLSRLRSRLRVLWGDRTTKPAYRAWMARSHLLDTVAIAVRNLLDSKRAPCILAALLAQIPAFGVHMPHSGPHLPFPDDLDAARRAQIERLPIDPNAQAYAAWCLRVLEQDIVPGSTLIALHPDVAVALAPLLNADQQKAVAASPAAQGWDSMTVMHWAVACAPAQEQPMPPIQRRIL